MKLTAVRESVRAVLDKVPGGAQRVLDAIKSDRLISSPYVMGQCGCFVAKAICATTNQAPEDWKQTNFDIDGSHYLPIELYLMGDELGGWSELHSAYIATPHRVKNVRKWVREWMVDNGQVPQ